MVFNLNDTGERRCFVCRELVDDFIVLNYWLKNSQKQFVNDNQVMIKKYICRKCAFK